jgi:pimeloyl-ACP methyl ester carboxylesterase
MSRGDIVLLHGAFVGGWIFEPLRAELSRRGWRTHAPDLPFHDRSFAGRPPHPDLHRQRLADYRRYVEDEIARLSQKPVLVGHSMGGLLAQQIAARDMAGAAVLLAPVAPWGMLPHTFGEVAGAAGLLVKAGNLWRKTLAPDFAIAAEYSMLHVPPARQRDIFARLVPESGHALSEMLFWWMDWHAGSHVPAHRVNIPMLVLAGEDDRVTPAPTCRAVAGRYRGHAVYREVPGLGHFIFGEPREADVIGIVAEWIDSQAP